jgi:hypothetical protein
MAFFEESELKELYTQARDESYQWRKDYPELERLADNGLIDDLDETLDEVNDGELSAGLFKLPKRIVNSDLKGRFSSTDTDEAWVTELANIYWENRIIKNANYKAPWARKWKDVVRKAAIYGGQPVISLLVDDGKGGTKADIDVPYAQDVRLEPGKVSDTDSDVIFWDVYYTRKQVRDMLEQAKREMKDNPQDGYNKWNVKAIQAILDSKNDNEDRSPLEDHESKQDKSVTKGGIKFCIVFQRGVKAPFYMYHSSSNQVVREWENPDPTGDIPIKYLFCYQDFNNPYGIGIVRLAGGTQNVLDHLRRLHILATKIGIRPPVKIKGDENEVDEDSLIYAENQPWYVGNADVEPVNMANGVYQQLGSTIQMYKASLQSFIPMGDTSITAEGSGNPQRSRTPAGVKLEAAQLSIDDNDFKDNLYMTYEAVAENLINLTFANMQGTDILKLSNDEMKILASAGLEIPVDPMTGEPATNELEILWDEVRSTFTFEMEAEEDQRLADEQEVENMVRALELRAADPNFDMAMQMSGYKFNLGEAYYTLMKKITKNDKIVEEISAEDKAMVEQGVMGQGMVDPNQAMQDPSMNLAQPQEEQVAQSVDPETARANVEAVMAEYGIDQETAAEALIMEDEGESPEVVMQAIMDKKADMEAQNA